MSTSKLADRVLSTRAKELGAVMRGHPPLEFFSYYYPMEGVVDLGVAPAVFGTPAHIAEALKQALDEGYTVQSPWAGFLDLREAIAEKLARENGLEVDPKREIMVTTGTQEAILVTSLALLDPGDEVIVPSPFFSAYRDDAVLAGARLVRVQSLEGDTFEVDPTEIEKCISSKTKAIVLNTPHNPSGHVIPRETLGGIGELAKKHDLIVVVDELYEKWVFDGHTHHSIGSLPGMEERTITIQGFSKAYSMTGFRVGYLAGPEELVQKMILIKHSATIAAPAISQRAALAALTGPTDWRQAIHDEFMKRRRLWTESLAEMGLPHTASQGCMYILVNITSTGMTSGEFAEALLEEAKVKVSSAAGAGAEGYIRASFNTPTDDLKEGLRRMKEPVLAWQKR
jgi:aminotransferase